MTDRVEWVKAIELHEYAEVLSIPTELVMSVREADGVYAVLYTPDHPENHMIWAAVMQRDEYDVLQVVGSPEPQPGLWEKMKAGLDAEIAKARDE